MILRSDLRIQRAFAFYLLLMALGAMPIGCGSREVESVDTVAQGAATISITGTVLDAQGKPLPSVTISLTGAATATTTTALNGSYAFTGLPTGTFDVQPTLTGCSFVPTTLNLSRLKNSSTANFAGSGSTCGGTFANVGATTGNATISGKVTDSMGNPVPGVRINMSGGTLAIRTTTAAGTYSFQVNSGPLYTLRPTVPCSYTPSFISLGRLQGNKSQNFVFNSCPNACVPTTCSAAHVACGPLADGCGGTLQCGSCPTGQTCTAGQCVCQPTTTCPVGQTCGTAPNGCGGTIDCGTCAAPQTCGGGGVPNQCGCTPTTTCPAGQNCNTAPDGCGGTVDCGTCTPPEACGGAGTPNQCAIPVPPCDLNTSTCLASRDKPGQPADIRCSQCAVTNGCMDPARQGGGCEDTTGIAPTACASVIGTMSTPTETQVCLATLKGVFDTQCAASLQLAPCLCGTTDVGQCLDGSVPPNGLLYPVYVCDFGDTNVGVIQSNFTNQTFGAGQANALVQCLGAFGCDCF